MNSLLTLKDPFNSESCIEIKIELNFFFSYFFVVPQKVLFLRHRKEVWKQKFNLIFSLCPGLGR